MTSDQEIGRRKPAPAHGVRVGEHRIEYVTVCTKDRRPWLACDKAHQALLSAWKTANAWIIGRYVIMPDHLHFFCAPNDPETALSIWSAYWKRLFSRTVREPDWRWQVNQWDTRIRDPYMYHEKWIYMEGNPAAKGLVANGGEWPYQGEIVSLRW